MRPLYWVLICGSRGWHDAIAIEALLNRLQEKHGQYLAIVHGGAKGADEIAGTEAKIAGIKTAVERAQWDKFGKGAGPIRNQLMLARYPIQEVHAFRTTGKSSGTDDMVRRADRAGILTVVYSNDGTKEQRDFLPVTPQEIEEVRTSIQK